MRKKLFTELIPCGIALIPWVAKNIVGGIISFLTVKILERWIKRK